MARLKQTAKKSVRAPEKVMKKLETKRQLAEVGSPSRKSARLRPGDKVKKPKRRHRPGQFI